MKCLFYVGQKVVCVNDHFENEHREETLPKAGHIYTVREIEGFEGDDNASILVKEIYNQKRMRVGKAGLYPAMTELHFYVWRFKPLEDTPTKSVKKILADA
jgi:hypothetical protein